MHDCTSWWWVYVWLPVLQWFVCWLLISTFHGSIVQPEVTHLHLIHIFSVLRIFLHIFLPPCRCWKVRGCLITHEGRRRGKHSCCKAFWSFWLPACSCHSVWLEILVDFIFWGFLSGSVTQDSSHNHWKCSYKMYDPVLRPPVSKWYQLINNQWLSLAPWCCGSRRLQTCSWFLVCVCKALIHRPSQTANDGVNHIYIHLYQNSG